MSCSLNQAYFTQNNGNNQIYLGVYWSRTISVTVDSQSRVYDDITLDGCVSVKDSEGQPLEIMLTEQVDDSTTGIYKIPAVLPETEITQWKLSFDVATTTNITPGLYNFTIFGTPLDGKKYVELIGIIEFIDTEDC